MAKPTVESGHAWDTGVPRVAALAALLILAPSAGAVLPGVNGKIVFVSGRDGTDATSRLYFKDAIGSQGGGAILARSPRSPASRSATRRSRRTARRSPSRPAARAARRRSATSTPSTSRSRARRRTGVNTNLTNSADLRNNQKPAWSPDSQFIYYSFGDPNSTLADAADILRKPANGTGPTPATPIVAITGSGEWQPSISPDGTRMCFTFQAGGTATAEVWTANLTGTLPAMPGPDDMIATTPAVAEYNCSWSPDGTKIAYVEGAFGTGELVQQSFPKEGSA